MRPRANNVIDVLITVSVAAALLQIVSLAFSFFQRGLLEVIGTLTVYAIAYSGVVAVTIAGLIALVIFDHKDKVTAARYVSRTLVVLLILSSLLNILVNGLTWVAISYLLQFLCVIAYQLYNDPNLARPLHFRNPFKRTAQEELLDPDASRKKYIPLNFFNMFWIFMVACVVGLCIEMIFCAIVNGSWQDRAGLLWGPFSPIYGFGALLMTIVLNRFWNKNMIVIFIISGLIGSAFEFFVSWYMETSFGILAWDYSGTFLNIQGRTNFAFFLAWGALGLVWIRMLLPVVMRFVNLIPLRWRAIVTVVSLACMLFNGCTTLLALDAWSKRDSGVPVQTSTDQFFAQYFDDQVMQARFQTMGMSSNKAIRAQH